MATEIDAKTRRGSGQTHFPTNLQSLLLSLRERTNLVDTTGSLAQLHEERNTGLAAGVQVLVARLISALRALGPAQQPWMTGEQAYDR
eukprot:759528-Hanusia_phi.AAC.1